MIDPQQTSQMVVVGKGCGAEDRDHCGLLVKRCWPSGDKLTLNGTKTMEPALDLDLAAPQGFEPRYADPESAVLPLNEGAAIVRKRGRAARAL